MFSWRRGQAYSQDLRERVLAADDHSARPAAERFAVCVSYVNKARQRRDRHGQITPGPQRSSTPRKLAEHHAAIDAHVREHPDATLVELCAWVLAEFGVSASIGTMWNTLRRLGLTLKKSASRRLSGDVQRSLKHAACGPSCKPNWTSSA
jgi:transposase